MIVHFKKLTRLNNFFALFCVLLRLELTICKHIEPDYQVEYSFNLHSTYVNLTLIWITYIYCTYYYTLIRNELNVFLPDELKLAFCKNLKLAVIFILECLYLEWVCSFLFWGCNDITETISCHFLHNQLLAFVFFMFWPLVNYLW